MARLLLLSKNFTETVNNKLQEITHKQPKEIKIIFCDNAADLQKQNEKSVEFVEIAKQELNNYGYQIDFLNLREYVGKEQELIDLLKNYNATFFTGGYYYALLDAFYQTGLIKSYENLLNNGLIHIGFSAGAMIMSREMKYYSEIEPDKEYSNKHEKGLGLFDGYIFPHYYDKPKYTKAFEFTVKKYGKEGVNLIPLTNNQTIFVDKNDWEII